MATREIPSPVHSGSQVGVSVLNHASLLRDRVRAEFQLSHLTLLDGFSPGIPVFRPYQNRLTVSKLHEAVVLCIAAARCALCMLSARCHELRPS